MKMKMKMKRKVSVNPKSKRKLQWLAERIRPKQRKEAKVYMTDKETHMLAVVNMDWDHIKAVDLYMALTSCTPEGGRVLSVSIYPTIFGQKCMHVEATLGPCALIGADCEDCHPDSDTGNNKLHTYGVNRQRFYYAVVVCDSSATALHLYTTFDGTEFLKTANVFDLRFISDCVKLEGEDPTPAYDVATENTGNCTFTWDIPLGIEQAVDAVLKRHQIRTSPPPLATMIANKGQIAPDLNSTDLILHRCSKSKKD